MNVCLISQDDEIDSLFRRVSIRFPEVRYTVLRTAAGRGHADLHIWDLDGIREIPTLVELGDETQHAFLLAAEDLVPLHRRLTSAAVRVLLKPVQEPVLERFLEEALARWRQRQEFAGDGRRAERDDLLQCLLLASFKLQQHATDRSNFVTRALQDLWAPLTAADGYCAILLHQAAGGLNQDQADAVRQLQASVHRARKAANLMSQLGLEAVHSQPPLLSSGDILQCIEKAAVAAAPSARAKEISLTKRLTPPFGLLYFDSSQVEQALVSLLENGVRFTPRSGSVSVKAYPVAWSIREFRLRSADGRWFRPVAGGDGTNAFRIDVSDPGPPVPLSSANRVFDQYSPYCGKNDRSGLGLGLATCRLSAFAHGGWAFVEPQAEGATFSVVLPFVRPENPEPAVNRAPAASEISRG